MINPHRIRRLNQSPIRSGPVIYWMNRDQRLQDNWALIYAQKMALETRSPLAVAFCLVPDFLGATLRQYDFMLTGLRELQSDLDRVKIPLFLLEGQPKDVLPALIAKTRSALLITDFNPLRIKRQWEADIAEKIDIPFHQVDAHNIVPCTHASAKQEFAARTLRPKIHRLLPEFFDQFPRIKKHPHPWTAKPPSIRWDKLLKSLPIDRTVPPVDWIKPGSSAAQAMLDSFLDQKLSDYPDRRNDPTRDAQSNLSPYLHFGQISAQRVALAAITSKNPTHAKDAFLEELIVRKELSDNFCFYNPQYDTFNGFPDWAKKTLNAHRRDKRTIVYSLPELQDARTMDPLWNASQIQMVRTGKMHGYMRMYWAKKILEWSKTPEQALENAIHLNDRYELDGRDPNGYVGVAWSIGGVHDRPWKQRPVSGTIRVMSYAGARSKFDVETYVKRYANSDPE